MNAQPHYRGTYPLTAARTACARLGRLTAVLAAVTAGLLVTVCGVPAAFARPVPPPGGSYGPAGPVPATTIVHVITTGGMAGWQITLIALAAALLAATVAVFADRARAARRGTTTAA
jgi:hypothetical protein